MYGTARLSPRTRAFLVSESLRLGVVRAAKNNGTSRRTVYRWRGRQGAYGDRSSRPHRSPRRTPDPVEASVLGLRLELRWGPDLIGPYLGLNPSTVHRILRRHGAHRLSHLFPQPRRSFGRFDISEPGELVAIDIKSLGRLDRGGGRRGPRHSQAGGTVGWRHLHVALDLASRLVYAELLPGKGNADTTAFVARALAFLRCTRHPRATGCSPTTAPDTNALPRALPGARDPPHPDQAVPPLEQRPGRALQRHDPARVPRCTRVPRRGRT